MKRKRINLLMAVSVMIIMMLGIAGAEDMGGMNITCDYRGTALSGAEISIIKIADAQVINNAEDGSGEDTVVYTLIPALSNYSVVGSAGYELLFDDMSAARCIELAEDISKLNLPVTDKRMTDDRGTVTFNDLELGMYLVMQTGKSGVSENYTMFSPYLISIPTEVNGELVDYVSCTPKTVVSIDTSNTDENYPPISDVNTPETGDGFNVISYIVPLVLAIIILVVLLLKTKDIDKREK